MTTALTFNDVTLSPVQHQGSLWIRAAELARALGYSDDRKVSIIYARHKDEFSNDMSVVLNLSTTATPAMTRLFSPRGCHMIAMLARTKVAKAFRRWVLDVLDKFAETERQLETLASDAPLTPEQQCTLQNIVKAKVEALPEAQRKGRGLYPQIWSRFNNHFRIARYCQLPQCRLAEAVAYLVRLDIEPKPKALPTGPCLSDIPAIEPAAYECGKRFFDEVAHLRMRAEVLKGKLHLFARPGARSRYLSPEKEALYASASDAANVAVTSLCQTIYALRMVYNIRGHVEFEGR